MVYISEQIVADVILGILSILAILVAFFGHRYFTNGKLNQVV